MQNFSETSRSTCMLQYAYSGRNYFEPIGFKVSI